MKLQRKREKEVFIPNDPDNGSVIIRKLSLNEISKIESKSSTLNVDADGTPKMTVDPYSRATAVAKACIVTWNNLFDENGNPLIFSKKVLNTASNYDIDVDGKRLAFFTWIDQEHTKFLEEVEKEEKEAAKN